MASHHHDQATDIYNSVRWYVLVRLLFLLAIAVPSATVLLVFTGWTVYVERNILLAVVTLFSNLVFYVLARLQRHNATYHRYLAGFWITSDTLLVSTMIFVNGGIESRSLILYTIPILMAAAILGRRAIYITATGSAVLYSSLLVGDYLGIIRTVGSYNPELRNDLTYVLNSIAFFTAVLLVIAVSVDYITRLLIQKSQQARASTIALARAQEIAKLGSWEWDIKSDTVSWSDELYRIFGISERPAKLDYTTYLHLVHPDDSEAVNHAIKHAMEHKVHYSLDYRLTMPDGSLKYIHSEGRPLLDSHGTLIAMSGTVQDVTEAHALDAVKRDFVSLASHQLRTPASGVQAFLALLLDGYGGQLNEQQSGFVQRAYEANSRQLEIIENLLNTAALESGKLSPKKDRLELKSLVKDCLPPHQLKATAQHQKLSLHMPRQKIYVNADPTLLQMAIDNLLSNALKYTPNKGLITVSLRQAKSSAYIEVTDTGIGIAKPDLQALFKKFSRINSPASQQVSGTGLGLYLAHNVVKLQRGSITVKSVPGKGTTFRIRLPLASDKPTG